jgi:putative glycosyltransferase
VPPNLITARLMTRRYVEALVSHRDREVFLAGVWAATGFLQLPLLVKKGNKGETTYNLARKIAVTVNSITSFSTKPLVIIFYLGLSISAAAGLAAGWLVFRRLFLGVLAEGWPSLMVSVWFLGGLTLLCLGVIGIYLAKVFGEVKPWPYTIIRKVYDHDEAKT